MFIVLYSYALYPLILAAAARRRPGRAEPTGPEQWPRLSLLIAAHDEERFIAARLANALAMDYPADRLEVVVASDGSEDATDQIVSGHPDPRVRLLRMSPRGGKARALNAALPTLAGEIVAFSDANTFYEPDAARLLVGRLADPGVGAAVGKLILTDPRGGRNVDGAYWKYETFLKVREGRLGALLGANGAIYAVRKSEYVPIPDNTIVDDFVIPLIIAMRTRKRIVYEPAAVAHEETPASIRSEWGRRARIGAGGFQAIGLLWPLLDPRRGAIAWAFWSHKVLRWAVPFALIALLGSSAALAVLGWRGFGAALALQGLFYGLAAALAFAPPPRGRVGRLLRLTTMFTAMNLALLAGFFRWSRGLRAGTWSRTERADKIHTGAGA